MEGPSHSHSSLW